MQNFKTTLILLGSKTLIPLPFDPNDVWGEKKRHHIHGTVNEIMIRGPLSSNGSTYFISPGPAWLRDAGMAAGDSVEVEIYPEGPQVDALAEDISQALESEPQAKAFYESLATFYRKGYLRWIGGASRRPEVRANRIQEMIGLLKEGKKQR